MGLIQKEIGYMPKKKPNVKAMQQAEDIGVMSFVQHDVPDSVEKYNKILPKEVFGKRMTREVPAPKKRKIGKGTKTGKVPKGSHRMPDGTIMKDSAMKSKKPKPRETQNSKRAGY